MADVKELGKMMEIAHSKCMDELTILAKKKSIAIPTSLTDNGHDAYKKLSNLAGTSFDK
jgi:putative membrane protein